MQYNKNLAKILIIAVSIILFTSIFIATVYFGKEKEENKIGLDDAKKVLSLDERADGILAENVVVTHSADGFARGKLTDSNTGEEKDFYMIKIGDVWRVVDITDKPVSCERFARLGFPSVFIQDCQLTFSDAVTLSEIDATLEDLFKSSNNFSLKIIATVETVQETENGQLVTVNSGGELVEILISKNDPAVKEGDLLVTSITAPNSQSQNSDSTKVIYQSNNSMVVNEQDRDLFDNTTTTTNTQAQTPDVPESNKIYKINAPKTYAPPAYFPNIYDKDNSFLDVEINGDF